MVDAKTLDRFLAETKKRLAELQNGIKADVPTMLFSVGAFALIGRLRWHWPTEYRALGDRLYGFYEFVMSMIAFHVSLDIAYPRMELRIRDIIKAILSSMKTSGVEQLKRVAEIEKCEYRTLVVVMLAFAIAGIYISNVSEDVIVCCQPLIEKYRIFKKKFLFILTQVRLLMGMISCISRTILWCQGVQRLLMEKINEIRRVTA